MTASLTGVVKDELSAVRTASRSARVAQLSAMVRMAGHLTVGVGGVTVSVEVDRQRVALRVRDDISELFGYIPCVLELRHDSPERGGRYVVRVGDHGTALMRRLGLLDRRGHPVRGLPATVVGGSVADIEATWRGALLATGHVTTSRQCIASVRCPSVEAAMALTGAARRLGVEARSRHVDGHQVVIRDADSVSVLLRRIGGGTSRAIFDRAQVVAPCSHPGPQFANFDVANARRTQVAAAGTIARVTRAFEILGDSSPEHLAQCGRLRLEHPAASLDTLGRLADPPVSKDTVAGRLRRLLAVADARAHVDGVRDTTLPMPASTDGPSR